MVEEYKKKGGHIIGEDISADSDKENKIKNHKNIKKKKQDDDENNNDLNNDDSDSDYDVNKMMKKSKRNEINDKDNSQTSKYVVWILYNKIYLVNKRFNIIIFIIYR